MTTPSCQWFSKLYNRSPPVTWIPRSPNIMSSSFYHTELNKALSEQAFGIARFDIQSSSSHEATASVALLEGKTIRITLNARGYQVRVAHVCMSLPLTPFSLMVVRSSNLSKVFCRPSAQHMRRREERLYSRACEAYDRKLRSLERRVIDPTVTHCPFFVARNIIFL